jgi:hypothetical protein
MLDEGAPEVFAAIHGNYVPLTLEEHRDLSHEILTSRARLREVGRLVSSVYGGESASGAAFHEALNALDGLCAQLAAQAAEDCPEGAIEELYR